MTRSSLSLAVSLLLAGATLAGCAKPASDEAAATNPPAAQTPAAGASEPAPAPEESADIFRFKVGELDAVALHDGTIDTPNDGKTFGVGQKTEDVAALLAANGQPTDVLHLSVQPLLLRVGDRTVLFDTGAGDVEWAKAGKLQASLRAAGVEPSQVTDIFISHGHPDHVGGLLAKDGALAFPNATVHLSAPEWAAMQKNPNAATLVAAIGPKVKAFEPGAAVLAGITAVALEGHTPGHSAYEIASGEERLLYIGDAAHHHVVSVQRPDWTIGYDVDAPKAEAARRALLKRAADGNLRVYAVHFPFPGLGHVKAQGDAFVWVPEK
ncbi:MBL fold metallo-hydrolase [Lysobacter arvi]|uniref:MBL fold metallo-hydrolase n=1 Tax=Lysobacter arvi TaxID=3038776 RepID=A0ABU1CI95_9GAMM|nr:MBL fold metallo-hydrolase [Lysobacter arvi]MDR0184676.1 MBL fold metallo-hydrolase [Lysobacter arvi]